MQDLHHITVRVFIRACFTAAEYSNSANQMLWQARKHCLLSFLSLSWSSSVIVAAFLPSFPSALTLSPLSHPVPSLSLLVLSIYVSLLLSYLSSCLPFHSLPPPPSVPQPPPTSLLLSNLMFFLPLSNGESRLCPDLTRPCTRALF